jgi:hypothetical protein
LDSVGAKVKLYLLLKINSINKANKVMGRMLPKCRYRYLRCWCLLFANGTSIFGTLQVSNRYTRHPQHSETLCCSHFREACLNELPVCQQILTQDHNFNNTNTTHVQLSLDLLERNPSSSLTHGAEHFLRSRQLYRYWRTSQHF